MRYLLGVLTVSLLLGSCSSLNFTRAMPEDAEVIRVLPDWVDGMYEVDSGSVMQFERLSDTRCLIYAREFFEESQIPEMIAAKRAEDGVFDVKLLGRSLFIDRDTEDLEVINFEKYGDVYLGPGEFLAVLDLEKNTMANPMEEDEPIRIMLRKCNGEYYLNMLEGDDYWILMKFQQEGENLNYIDVASSKIAEDISYYSSIAPMRKLEDGTVVCEANDEQLVALLNEPDLFETEIWKKLSLKVESGTSGSGNYNNYLLMAALFIIGIGLGRIIKT